MSKIDYEITVDVRNLSVEEKKKVQDAFFKLGIGWRLDGCKHDVLTNSELKYYTNKVHEGSVEPYLMWSFYNDETPTHTPEQLFELAGMNDVPEGMEPFDLERALAGDPVVTRDGCDILEMHYFEASLETYRVYAVSDRPERVVFSYNEAGRFGLDGKNSDYDLFMKKKTHIVNGFEVPLPLKIALKKGDRFWVEILSSEGFCTEIVWGGGAFSKMVMERGIAHSTEEGAIANAKARLGIDPHS